VISEAHGRWRRAGPIRRLQPGTRDLPAKDGELVAEEEDLQVLGGPAAGQQRKELDGAVQREVGDSWQHPCDLCGETVGKA
jgi:hypothetical protein